MRKRLTAVALAGTVGLAGMGVAAYPALADSTTKESLRAGSEAGAKAAQEQRKTAIRDALKGLVDDKTLTQEQADKVADTLGTSGAVRGLGGPGGPGFKGEWRRGGGLLGVEGPQADEAAAAVLGLSVEDLRTALRAGSTLAELAKKQGKDVERLVDALVTAAKTRLAAEVKAGRITQETADQIEKTLEQRVRTVVQNGRPGPGSFGGPRGHGDGPGGRMGTDEGKSGDAPAPDPSPSGSANSSSFSTT